MGDTTDLQKLGDQFCTAVKAKTQSRYKDIEERLDILMTLIKQDLKGKKPGTDHQKQGPGKGKTESKLNAISPMPSVEATPSQNRENRTKVVSTQVSQIRDRQENPLQRQIIDVKPFRSEETETDETKALSGTIYQKEEEKIRRLQAENHYLRTALDGIHKTVIDGEKTALKELKTPKSMKDDQSILEVEANIKGVTQKFHEIEADADNAIKERKCLLQTLECLCNHVRDLSKGKTEADLSATLDEIRSSITKESMVNQGLSHAREISSIYMEWKSESPAPYVVVRGVGSASSLRSMSRASSASYESVHGFGSTSTIRSEAEQALQLLDKLYKQAAAVIEKTDTSTIAETTKGGKGKGKLPIKLESHQVSDKFKSVSSVFTEMVETIMEIRRLQAENQYLRAALDGIHKTIIDGDKTILETPKSMKGDQSILEVEANIKEVTQTFHEIKTLRMDLGKKTKQVEDLRIRLQKMQDDNTKIKNDVDTLRTRLSEHAGAFLIYENPSIADLSDPNRPTKISEKYSELYDNQWTDAFSNISKRDPSISEDKMIGFLYEMLVDGYRFCQDVRQKQKSGLEDLLFYPAGGMKSSQREQKGGIGKIFSKNLNDVTKFSSNETSANMAEAFVEDKGTKDKYGEKIKLCDNYIRECVQLCWHMQVQTPPLYLDLKTIQGQAFDKNCYREYTKKGKKIAFVVWPALFLHENGPLLHKGVVQGQ